MAMKTISIGQPSATLDNNPEFKLPVAECQTRSEAAMNLIQRLNRQVGKNFSQTPLASTAGLASLNWPKNSNGIDLGIYESDDSCSP